MKLHEAPMSTDLLRVAVPCSFACPAHTRVPDYIRALSEDDPATAYRINVEDNLFPGILGRICTRPCEEYCRHGRGTLGEPVAICHLKRVSFDELPSQRRSAIWNEVYPPAKEQTGKNVLVVGAGPAGLTVALRLHRLGHAVTIWDESPNPGGMMSQAIPRFRLPDDVVKEDLRGFLDSGIVFETRRALGSMEELFTQLERQDAVILATGCMVSHKLGVPGEDLPGCHSGLDFVRACRRGEPPALGKRVLVVGGGFTAIDCARLALRLGGEQVSLLLRRERSDMSVPERELHPTLEEGVTLRPLGSVLRLSRTESGLRALVTDNRIEIDAHGKRKAVAVPGSERELETDAVLVAIGQKADESLFHGKQGVWHVTNPQRGETDVPKLFVAGDLAHGSKTVIDAIAQAKQAAQAVHGFLTGEKREGLVLEETEASDTPRPREWDELPRQALPRLDTSVALSGVDRETEMGLGQAESIVEARRCYLCNLRYAIRREACVFCDKCIAVCPQACIHYTYDGQRDQGDMLTRLGRSLRFFSQPKRGIELDDGPCIRCGLCYRACPASCIDVTALTPRWSL